jgi:hypothetical protein
MDKGPDVKRRGSMRGGFVAILGLLVVVAIILVLYGIQAQQFFGTSGRVRGNYQELPAWRYEELLVERNDIVALPGEPRVEIGDGFEILAAVERNSKNRGDLVIKFAGSGHIEGRWECEYGYEGRAYSYAAEFEGNVSIERVYEDREGREDESLLYFIAKGEYTKTTSFTGKNYSEDKEGVVYVDGWVGPGGDVRGRITLTTDKSWSAEYEFDTGSK